MYLVLFFFRTAATSVSPTSTPNVAFPAFALTSTRSVGEVVHHKQERSVVKDFDFLF